MTIVELDKDNELSKLILASNQSKYKKIFEKISYLRYCSKEIKTPPTVFMVCGGHVDYAIRSGAFYLHYKQSSQKKQQEIYGAFS